MFFYVSSLDGQKIYSTNVFSVTKEICLSLRHTTSEKETFSAFSDSHHCLFRWPQANDFNHVIWFIWPVLFFLQTLPIDHLTADKRRRKKANEKRVELVKKKKLRRNERQTMSGNDNINIVKYVIGHHSIDVTENFVFFGSSFSAKECGSFRRMQINGISGIKSLCYNLIFHSASTIFLSWQSDQARKVTKWIEFVRLAFGEINYFCGSSCLSLPLAVFF